MSTNCSDVLYQKTKGSLLVSNFGYVTKNANIRNTKFSLDFPISSLFLLITLLKNYNKVQEPPKGNISFKMLTET